MNFDAEIICRRTEYGDVCEWKGGRLARVYGSSLFREKQLKTGDVFNLGRLRLRLVAFPVVPFSGVPTDSGAVMLESPHAQLYWLYRKHAERLVRFSAQVEMRLMGALYGLMLWPFPEGKLLPITSRIADALL